MTEQQVRTLCFVGLVVALLYLVLRNSSRVRAERKERIRSAFSDLADVVVDMMGTK